MEENLSLAAFNGLPRKLLLGDLGGVVELSSSFEWIEGFGLETAMGFLWSMESSGFLGDRNTDVETDLICPSVLVVRSGTMGSRTGDIFRC